MSHARQTKTGLPQPRCGWKICSSVTQGSSFLATLGWRTQSLWDWPDRGCGEAQTSTFEFRRHVVMVSTPYRVRSVPPSGHQFVLSPLAHISPNEARTLRYVEFRNPRLRLPAFGGSGRAGDLWREDAKRHAFSSSARRSSRGMRDRRTRTDGWFR